ncbi:MAG: transcriptional activator NhaR [Deltaproteobacteria bacterium]|nr:transcriptional activator NhaR [Deltaproteobacteria bacterium]
MEWINYHHLLYFWVVAKEGTVTKAAEVLRLRQPTVSEQLKSLESSLGEQLFDRSRRRLALTDSGRLVFRYADEIFRLGQELQDTLAGRPSGRPFKLRVGVSDVVPKLLLHRLLEPALRMDEPVQIVCREDKTDRLLAELSVSDLDLVLADAPLAGQARVRAFNHLLGECGVSFFAISELASAHRERFPSSLDDAPLLLPTDDTLLRRSLEHWFDAIGVRPRIIAEFEDSALLKQFGQHGEGLFAGPTAVEQEICEQYGVVVLGRTERVVERFYAITVERRIKHPAVRAISNAAHRSIFG